MALVLGYRDSFSLWSWGRRRKNEGQKAEAFYGTLDFSNPYNSGWL